MPIALFNNQFLFGTSCKSDHPAKWWPEYVLMFKVFSSNWKKQISPLRDAITASVDFDKAEVKPRLEKKLVGLIEDAGVQTWNASQNKFRQLIKVTRKKAGTKFVQTINRRAKGDPELDSLYDSLYEQAQKLIESHPERVLHPQIVTLLDQIKNADRQNRVLLDNLKERLEYILNQDYYWDNISSTQASFIWNASGIETAETHGIKRYTILNPWDVKTCIVCKRIHGAVFTTDAALDYLQRRTEVSTVEDLKNQFPFPRESVIGHMGIGDIEKSDFKLPPYHGNCRDVIKYLE